MRAWVSVGAAVWLMGVVSPGAAAEDLKPETIEAYERYTAGLEERFSKEFSGDDWLQGSDEATLARLRSGEIVAWPGHEDGILDAPGGLIHHWRGAAFIPGVSLDEVLATAQNYHAYSDKYQWILHSSVLGHERRAGHEQFRLMLRLHQSASFVTSVVDIWSEVEYRYPRPDRATAVSDADCVRQVEDAGKASERRLPVGEGNGFLWRANTYSAYLERDGGVYVDLQTVGLSRGFPPLLGWMVEPIARRIGRGSASESLKHLRDAVIGSGSGAQVVEARAERQSVPPVAWCGG